MLLVGVYWTLATAALSWLVALVVGSAVGTARTLPSVWMRRLSIAYVELFRNVPLLVQLFIWYFVVPEILPDRLGTWIKLLQNAPFWTASLGLGLYTAARVAEQVRAGLEAVPRGQFMAASALGLNLRQAYANVLLPRVFRVILPPLTSEFLNNTKNTSVALTIGLLEVTAQTRAIQEFSFQVFEPFVAATLFYVTLNLLTVSGMRAIERRSTIAGYNVAR